MIELVSSALVLFGLGPMADAFFKPSKRENYANLIFSYRPHFMSEVADFTVALFSLVFDGKRHKILVWRSFLLSIFLFCSFSVLTTLMLGENLIDVVASGSHESRTALVTVVVMNCFADYLSLCQTKYLMKGLVRKPILVQFLGLLFDALLTYVVVAGSIALAFWMLASSAGIEGWSWSNPSTITWQMCHQIDSAVITLSGASTNITEICNTLSGRGFAPASNRNFEYAFNTASLLTSYSVTAWVLLFILAQVSFRGLQIVFKRYSKTISKFADYRKIPFSITSLFFAVIYFLIALFTAAI